MTTLTIISIAYNLLLLGLLIYYICLYRRFSKREKQYQDYIDAVSSGEFDPQNYKRLF